MTTHVSDSHEPQLPSSGHPAESTRPTRKKAFVRPTLEWHGSLPKITAGSNIFGDEATP